VRARAPAIAKLEVHPFAYGSFHNVHRMKLAVRPDNEADTGKLTLTLWQGRYYAAKFGRTNRDKDIDAYAGDLQV